MLIANRRTRRYERLCVSLTHRGHQPIFCNIESHAINAADCWSAPVWRSDSILNVAATSAAARDHCSTPVANVASANAAHRHRRRERVRAVEPSNRSPRKAGAHAAPSKSATAL